MALFTEEKYREILEARERLRKYHDKIQPYPLDPEEVKPQVIEHIVIHRHSNMGAEEYDLLQQTSLKADWLEKKLLEKEKPKQKPKKTGYKGLR